MRNAERRSVPSESGLVGWMLLEEAGSPLGLFESEQAAWSIQNPRLQRHVKNHNFIADVRSI
jgi:hypothetical protein